jgi:amino acid adenylation domain-containing protein
MTKVGVPRAQQRLWLADQLIQHGAVYLGSTNLRLRGRLDVAALENALRAIVTRHEVLRTSIVEEGGQVVGVLRPAGGFRMVVREVDAAQADAAVRAEAATPIDIGAEPPLRATLLRLDEEDHILCLTVHHAAYDGGSIGIVYQELAALYSGSEPPSPKRQYRDVAAEMDAREDSGAFGSLIAERRETLSGRESFELPPDLPRPPVRSGDGRLCHGFTLPAGAVGRLEAIAKAHRATLYLALLAGVHTVLHRYTGRSDVTTGASSSIRMDAASAALIGPFMNLVVIPGDVSGDPTFEELLLRVRDAALDAFDARAVAFDSLVGALRVDRDPAVTPLFQILVDMTVPAQPPHLPGLDVSVVPAPGAGSKYDLTVEFQRRDDGSVAMAVEWDTALYREQTVRRLMAHLRRVLEAVAEQPSLRTGEIPMLFDEEIAQLHRHAAPVAAEPPAQCLHELFAAQAARTPDAVAVRDGDLTLTYAQLDERSTRIAAGLAALGVGPDMPVGVLMDRSADLVAALLGILKAGGAYLPLDPETPMARAWRLLSAAAATICIVSDAVPGENGCRTVEVSELLCCTGEFTPVESHPEQVCAVYFTSGSTGQPKGVASTHRGWAGQMDNMQRCYGLRPGETVLFKTPLGFDDVAREIFWPLLTGGRIAVLPPGLHRDPRALIDAASRHGVVWLQFVPSMLELFLEEVKPADFGALGKLRHVTSDGDRLRPSLVRAFFAGLGARGVKLNNHWGTTEVSIDSTHHVCEPGDGDEVHDAVTLGKPMAHNEVYLLDRMLRPVPPGFTGELCIGGPGLARGYLHEPGRTAKAFVPHPWRAGERLYRTGDTGRLRPDGSLEYRGRRDHQIKVRGIRVELGEIEAAVRAFAPVSDAVVDTWEAVPGDRRIVAYVLFQDATDGAPDQAAALRAFLGDRLVPAAVPNAIVVLPELPRNPSGKVDRRSLPAPEPGSPSDVPYVEPETETEAALAEIWASVLGVPRLSATEDFFAAGGHSLMVTRAVNRMREAFGVDVSIRVVFEHPTVRAAAIHIEELVIADIEAMTEAEAAGLVAAHSREEADVGAG